MTYLFNTPICRYRYLNNNLYIKREDFIPFSFGGNKARKAFYFLEEIKKKKANYIVTYGSVSSNHCRVAANLAAFLKLPCLIITPVENDHISYNKKLTELLGAKRIFCKVTDVKETIDRTLSDLYHDGFYPYFIPGGGHGNLGTQAYVDCFQEIIDYEQKQNVYFPYVFFASGTGTTQAGLICGNLLNSKKIMNFHRQIIGISIARKKEYGISVIKKSICDYLESMEKKELIEKCQNSIVFLDEYIKKGYDQTDDEIDKLIVSIFKQFSIPLDRTYTGKAFSGMTHYILNNKLTDQNILFIHTGGTPLFFDFLEGLH